MKGRSASECHHNSNSDSSRNKTDILLRSVDEGEIHALPETSIVLYKDNRIVIYNPMTQTLCSTSRNTGNRDCDTLRTRGNLNCPLCMQTIDSRTFSYEATFYFSLLQGLMRQTTNLNSANFEPTNQAPDASEIPLRSSSEDLFSDVRYRRSATDRQGSDIPSHFLVTGYYDRFFTEIEKLGSGSYGHVYLCEHKLDDLSLGEYAVKKTPVGDNKTWLKKVLREVRLRERLRHPNVVDYKHAWMEIYSSGPLCPSVPWLFILMEYCNGGPLEDIIENHELEIESIWVILKDLLWGLQELHHHGILHRDLKPSNVLLNVGKTSQGDPSCRCLLADFGESELLSELRKPGATMGGHTGTIEFTAPEILEARQNHHMDDTDVEDVKSDIWSLGIILFRLLFGFLPFSDEDVHQCQMKILLGQDLLKVTPELLEKSNRKNCTVLVDLMTAMTSFDLKRRPFTDELLTHPFLSRWFTDPNIQKVGSAQLCSLIAHTKKANIEKNIREDPHYLINERRKSKQNKKTVLALRGKFP
eukprot:GHVP01063147.1.p1 GENE.GHVP01063147.1~~GHVP01063147.1.p1  ORF type:complete len:545 (+),score=59.89 GHVP01063147.1:49-1635(+)